MRARCRAPDRWTNDRIKLLAGSSLGYRMTSARLALGCAMLSLAAAARARGATPRDWDGAGAIAGDCAPLDAAIHPGAPDAPDLGFADTNCDGIDGDAAGAVWVAPTGSDAAA